jgi:hypothetical protein
MTTAFWSDKLSACRTLLPLMIITATTSFLERQALSLSNAADGDHDDKR